MTPIEVLALILIIVSGIKILVILSNPRSWLKVVRSIWATPVLTMILALIAAGISLYYLLLSGLTVVQILAVTLFVALVAALSMATYIKDIVRVAEGMLKDKKFLKKAWLPILVWVALILWGLKELFL